MEQSTKDIQELLARYRAGAEDAGDALFEKLQQQKLGAKELKEVTDALFRQNVTVKQEMAMHLVLEGPNGEAFERYVTRSLFSGAPEGRDDFAYASAAIKNCYLRRSFVDQLRAAGAQIRKESHPALVMQGLAMVSLFCRGRISHLGAMAGGLEMKGEKHIHMKLLSWLRNPDGACYRLCCDAVEGLCLLGSFDGAALHREGLIRAACHAWHRGEHRDEARQLLSLIPVDGDPVRVPDRKTLARKAMSTYRSHLRKGYHPGIVRDFRLCINMGCWKEEELRRRYRQLAVLLGREKKNVASEDQCHMLLLRQQMHRRLDRENPFRETDPADVCAMLCGMGSRELERLNAMAAEPDAVYRITDGKQAVEILEYVRREYGNDPAVTGDSAALLRRCRLETDRIGSCIITDWFSMLCCFGFIREALDFYTAHRAVLDRPWCYIDGLLVDGDWTGLVTYGKFLKNPSRLARAMDLALYLNQRELIRAFLDAVPQLQPEPMTGLLLEEEDPLAGELCVYRLKQLMGRITPESLPGLWNLYYDDRGVTHLILKNCPTFHSLVLRLGYGDDEEAALTAVTARGSSLMFVSERLKRDDEVCTAALRRDSAVLSMVRAPVRNNRTLLREILMANPIPLHRSPEWLRDDRDYVHKRVRRCGRELSCASERLREDPQLQQAAAEEPDRDQERPDTGWLFEDL